MHGALSTAGASSELVAQIFSAVLFSPPVLAAELSPRAQQLCLQNWQQLWHVCNYGKENVFYVIHPTSEIISSIIVSVYRKNLQLW